MVCHIRFGNIQEAHFLLSPLPSDGSALLIFTFNYFFSQNKCCALINELYKCGPYFFILCFTVFKESESSIKMQTNFYLDHLKFLKYFKKNLYSSAESILRSRGLQPNSVEKPSLGGIK